MSDISNVLRKVIELDISLGLDGTQEALDEITRLTAEVERLNKSRNKWGQKYNKLLEKHKVTLSQLKTAVWSDSEECKLLTAEVERLLSVTVVQETLIRKAEAESEKLRAALELFECDCEGEELCFNPDNCQHFIARAALSGDKQ